MKYAELIDFEPIDSVIELRDADADEKARSLVETFVISDRMAEQWTELVVPNLQYDHPADNKGILIVGNYGTGKSHLMSFISAVAEYSDVADIVKNNDVLQAARSITGKFKVVRTEIGATTMSLRDIIAGELQDHLADMGIDFTFPPTDKVRNNKDSLNEMMERFHQQFPNHGLLMVVDELLDYLRTRNDQELVLDLNFLREIGEVCADLRFRFIAGLQEDLFENPRFQFVAESVRRVKARFAQLRIIRDDVAFVVSERLLKKTPEQKARIRAHLEKFTPLYDAMAERLDEFVQLFPIHPAYLEQFERISVAEKREVLKTLSAEMRNLLTVDVPAEEPGLLSYDSYWNHLCQDAAVRAEPDVRPVMDKSNVLESRIQQAFSRKAYIPMAVRICRALSVHRLTTGNINAKVGLTASELRDGLCLFHPALPERNSDFLRTTVESCLNEIVKAMSGQFITHNKESDQYFLDLTKDIDYDTEIEKRSESLLPGELDGAYFDALKRLLECTDTTCVAGYRLWEHEVEWREHNVTRAGYLFLGAPNERPTAHAPRDFYIYLLPPFQPPTYKDEELADEIYFVLQRPDKDFDRALKLYAGARAMATQAGSGTRKNYEDKAGLHFTTLTHWLRQNVLTAFDVIHQGDSKTFVEFLKGQKISNLTVRELVNLVGSVALAPTFEQRYPEYPTFSVTLTSTNLADAAAEAIRHLSGGLSTKLAIAVLDGLELLDGNKIRPHASQYAKSILQKLEAKPQGQVLNRNEILLQKYSAVEIEADYKLEPELLVIVLLSLVYSGDVTLSLNGKKKIDSATLGESGKIPVEELCKFRHVERPKDIPMSSFVALFELVGLSDELIRNLDTREEAIRQLHERIAALVQRAVIAKKYAQSGLPCWGHYLIKVEKRAEYCHRLDSLQQFLEKLQAYNTPSKLKNFSATVHEVRSHEPDLQLLAELEAGQCLVSALSPLASYLATAKAVLPKEDPWGAKVDTLRSEWQRALEMSDCVAEFVVGQKFVAAMERCKREYQDHYLALHRQTRVGIHEEQKRRDLLNDTRLERLNKLARISLLPDARLDEVQNRLANLKPCHALVKDDLNTHPICPHCGFRPSDEQVTPSGAFVLDALDDEIDKLLSSWTDTLRHNLCDPAIQETICRLDDTSRQAVENVLEHQRLPEVISDEAVQGIQAALAGLTPISVKTTDLLSSLGNGSVPCTVDQFRRRFEDFVAETIGGKDVDKVRIVIQKGDTA